MSKFRGVKTDNAKINAKIEIREKILNHFDKSNVLEVFSGNGEMYNHVWINADSYVGIDKRKYFDSRKTFCGDAIACLNGIDISYINIFDIDSYGSPYACIELIIRKLESMHEVKGSIAFCVTDGTQIDMRMGRVSKDLMIVSGINFNKMNGVYKLHNLIILKVINNIAKRLNRDILEQYIAIGRTGSGMRYYAFILNEID